MAASDPHAKKKVVVAVGPRPVLSLLDLERYEPVLTSSPRSYMVADAPSPSAIAVQATPNVGDNSMGSTPELAPIETEHGTAQILPRTPPPHPPRRQKADSAAGASPRARMRPLPPVGIAAREDVDIYRYSQATELRIAIRPLFERRREAEAAGAMDKLTRSDEDGDNETLRTVSPNVLEPDNERASVDADSSAVHSDESDTREQGTAASNADECQQGVRLDVSDAEAGTAGDDIVDEICCDELDDRPEERDLDSPQHIRFVPAMRLSLANCHEPFLASEPPLMRKLRSAMQHTPQSSTDVTKPELSSDASGQLSAPLLRKLVWSGSCTISDRRVAVSITVASDGGICVSCTDQGDARHKSTSDDSKPAAITLTDIDLALMKKLRGDLTELSPQWANWLVSRLSFRDGNSIQLDLDEQNGANGTGRERVFSKIVSTSSGNDSESAEDREIAVDVFLLREEAALAVRMEDTQSKQTSELVLGKFELQSVAAAMGILDSTQDDAYIDGLLHNSAFLDRLCESDAVRLAMTMLNSPTLDPTDDENDDRGFATKSTDSVHGLLCKSLELVPTHSTTARTKKRSTHSSATAALSPASRSSLGRIRTTLCSLPRGRFRSRRRC